ncbi:hypothetical protein GGX14DRAFT_405982 [Mycena pura]|uniref:Uncharacterized protein n=1 Tax=Mycena pura TaxID=153505 RepID=A0AAD6UR97_9AGAR|nr:hypothetical protein GGX14DRAFT_405982 [Mycena pura]
MSNSSSFIGTPDNAVGNTAKRSSASSSDWLGPSLLAARAMTAAADSAPFPQKVKKNRDNLKQLCGNIIEIMKVVQSHAHFYEDSDATKLENVCMDFESALQAVLLSLRKIQTEPKGFRGRLKGMMNASGVADEIIGHEKKIQELRQNVMVNNY